MRRKVMTRTKVQHNHHLDNDARIGSQRTRGLCAGDAVHTSPGIRRTHDIGCTQRTFAIVHRLSSIS